jgi:ribosomal protein S3AE
MGWGRYKDAGRMGAREMEERKKDVAGDSSSSTEKVSLDIADVAELTFK